MFCNVWYPLHTYSGFINLHISGWYQQLYMEI